MRTHTKFFSYSKLANADGAATVVRIAMVCNDLAIANSAMGYFKNLTSNALSHIRQGAPLYFVRMSCGHLREGMRALREVRDHAALLALTKKCDARAQAAFAELCECLQGGRNHGDFERYVKPIRNTIASHYDPNEVKSALEFRTVHRSNIPCSITIGEDIHSCRFEFADVVLDTIVCRKLWQIPVGADVRAEADRIANWCFAKSIEFLDFGGDFVSRFLLEHAV